MLFGVCGGLGEYFKIDPTLVRLVLLLPHDGWPWLDCLCGLTDRGNREPLEVVEVGGGYKPVEKPGL
jgi:hypothetical protein